MPHQHHSSSAQQRMKCAIELGPAKHPCVPLNKITASCPRLACSWGAFWLMLSVPVPVRGLCTWPWAGSSLDSATPRLEGEKRGKGFSKTGVKCVTAPDFRRGSSPFLLAASATVTIHGFGNGLLELRESHWAGSGIFGMLKHGQARDAVVRRAKKRGVEVRKLSRKLIKK